MANLYAHCGCLAGLGRFDHLVFSPGRIPPRPQLRQRALQQATADAVRLEAERLREMALAEADEARLLRATAQTEAARGCSAKRCG